MTDFRRGISKFYNGKSKSFTSLGDAASTSSIKDITKPENAYTRKRRNLMAFNHVWDSKNRSFSGFPLRSNGGGISKRPISSSRSTLALAVAMSSSESSSSTSDESCSRSPPPLPPLHPQARGGKVSPSSPRQTFCASRSLPLVDVQRWAANSSATLAAFGPLFTGFWQENLNDTNPTRFNCVLTCLPTFVCMSRVRCSYLWEITSHLLVPHVMAFQSFWELISTRKCVNTQQNRRA